MTHEISLPGTRQVVKPALSAATIARYRALAERLLASAAGTLGRPWDADARAMVDVLAARRPEWSRATWRQYRAALVWFLNEAGYSEVAHYAGTLTETPCLRHAARTSAKKSKRLPRVRLELLVERLAESRGRYDRAIGLWLLSNYYVGLRPEEWWSVTWMGERRLKVRNAKDSQDRTFGTHRTLGLEAFTAQEMNVIRQFLAVVAAHADHARFYAACRKRLHGWNRYLWPKARKHITLYSGRHQFAADHKAAHLSREELAALMGHGSTVTAQRHYARRQHGRSRSRVSPSQEDVERVRARNRTRPRPDFRTR